MSERLRSVAPAAVAILALAVWLGVVIARVTFPFELEWMEGGVLRHVERVRAGEPLFVPPSLDFAPFPYTPLYYAVAAPASAVVPGSLVPLRIVSVLASLVSFACVAVLAARALPAAPPERRRLAGLLAAGTVAAAAEFTGGFGDLARVDALAWAFALASLVVAGRAQRARGALLAAALAACAFQTKQSTSLLVASSLVTLGLRARNLGLVYGFGLLGILGGATWLLDRASDGWYGFWVFELLAGAPRHAPAWLGYWQESGLALGGVFAVAVAAWVTRVFRPTLFGTCVPVIALLVTGWLGKLHVGGYDNNYLPTAFGAALMFGPAGAAWVGQRGARLAPLAVALAFLPLAHDPRTRVPGQDARRAGEAVVAALGDLGEPILVPDHGRLATRALGPQTFRGTHGMVWIDLLQSEHPEAAQTFVDALYAALSERRFRAVVTSEPWNDMPGLLENYLPPERLLLEAELAPLIPVTGAPRVPRWVYRVRDDGAPR